MINRVVLVGRLTRDPAELRRSTNNNNAFTSFTIACDNRFTKVEERKTYFIPCVAWGKTAEIVSQYVKKGALVGVEGRLQSRNYDAKDGHKVFVVEIVCDNVQLLESRSVSEQRTSENLAQPGYPSYQSQPEPSAPKQASQAAKQQPEQSEPSFEGGVDVPDDDLPF